MPLQKRYASSFIFLCLLFCYSVTISAKTTEKRTTLDDQTALAITIYNDNLALIKDQRKVSLDKGSSRLAFRGVSARMQPETAMLRSLSHSKGFNVIEQNFDFDLLTLTNCWKNIWAEKFVLPQ